MNEEIIYQKNKLFKYTRISRIGETIKFEEYKYGDRSIIQFHFSKLGVIESFTRVYHLGPIASSVFIGVLSSILLYKKWGTGEWTFYFALIPLCLILIGYLYYLMIGIHYGEVEISIGEHKKNLYMTKKDYINLREKIDKIRFATNENGQ